MWPDNETQEDLLGFSIHAKLLKAIITDSAMLPVTVGLFGDWGGGKSSILKILQRDIEQSEDCAVIYFNSWVFEGYEDAKSAILTTLLNELRNHRNLKDMIGDEIKNLLDRVNWMKILKTGASAGLVYLTANPLPLLMAGNALSSGKPPSSEDGKSDGKGSLDLNLLDGFLKTTQESVQNVRSFREDFHKLIKKTKLKSVIILIDDLDRCSPERLIENLEAIKLFLNVENTAFVVAADRRIVENAIRIRYAGLFTGEKYSAVADSLVTDYLEKLIQVPYSLPKLAPHEVRSYMSMLLLKKHLSKEAFADALAKYTAFVLKERYAAFQLKDELAKIEDTAIRSIVSESMRLVDACSDAITNGLKGNPRQIKRFLNAFWLRRELARVANLPHLKDHVLIKLMVLEYMSADCFDELYQWHRVSSDGTAEALGLLEKCETVEEIPEKYAKWKSPRFWRWIKAEPSLKATDLRDYYWVARSAISDTMTGIRLMTQAMKVCAEELISRVETQRQNGLTMFVKLMDDEQEGVLGMVMRHAMQEISEDASLRSLLDLAGKGNLKAAEAFERCVDRIGATQLNPGFGITLRSFKLETGNRASDIVHKVRENLSKTDTQVGRALQTKKKDKQ